jgi:hypothetical protein
LATFVSISHVPSIKKIKVKKESKKYLQKKKKGGSLQQMNTLASGPNSLLNIPIEPGPEISWVIRTSTLTQTFSPGLTWGSSDALAKIFSVIVIAVFTYKFTDINPSHDNTSTSILENEKDSTKELIARNEIKLEANRASGGRHAL